VRVALLSHTASPAAPTGAERSLALLAGGLALRGHQVTVAVPGPWPLREAVEALGVQVDELPVRACWLVQAGRPPLPMQLARLLRFAVPDPGFDRLRCWLRDREPDVVHVNCLPHLRGAAAARSCGLPVVWHIRELLPEGVRRRCFGRRVQRDANRVIAVSRAVAGWLEAEGLGPRVTTVYNGVRAPDDLPDRQRERSRLGFGEGTVVVAMIGQMVGHKGPFELVEAVARRRSEGDDVVVVLAGTGPRRLVAELAARVAAAGGCLLGPVAEPWPLLAACDVAAVPSRWPDPLPRSALEAMAAARPVVATRTGGLPEIVVDGDTGLLCEPGDAGGLAAAIGRLVREPQLRRRLGQSGRARATEVFSEQGHLDAMEGLLAEAARRGAGATS
jgi:glycosyltransferase involved in cell wall biosynthesis